MTNAPKVQIESGIPIPDDRRVNLDSKAPKYPWRHLQIGESFVAPAHASTSVTRANKVYGDRKFTARRLGDGTCRFWRIA